MEGGRVGVTDVTLLLARADARALPLANESVQMAVTSPPYWRLRSYATGDAKARELGGEATPDEYVEHLVEMCREVRRVLRDDGVFFLNLGDCYASTPGRNNDNFAAWASVNAAGGGTRAGGESTPERRVPPGLKPKDLCMIPARAALALQADGWWLRSQIPWVKRNILPESTTDRPTNAIEYVYLLSKSETYFYDAEAVRMPSTMKPQRRAAPHKKRQAMADGQPTQTFSTTVVRDEPAVESLDGRRNRRTSDWFFESWQGMATDDDGDPLALVVNPRPYKGAHYATFPEMLVEPMIRAGTSEHGACTKCGTPWKRMVEKGPSHYEQIKGDRSWREMDEESMRRGTTVKLGEGGQTRTKSGSVPSLRAASCISQSWQPNCSCDCTDVRPCIVLDPFCGSGVTGRVAVRLRRSAVCCDLSDTYLRDLATARTTNVQIELIA
jgi:DNA modification methylase